MAHLKPIQIAAVPETDDNYITLFALCEDGSIWYMLTPTSEKSRKIDWEPLPPILTGEDLDKAKGAL